MQMSVKILAQTTWIVDISSTLRPPMRNNRCSVITSKSAHLESSDGRNVLWNETTTLIISYSFPLKRIVGRNVRIIPNADIGIGTPSTTAPLLSTATSTGVVKAVQMNRSCFTFQVADSLIFLLLLPTIFRPLEWSLVADILDFTFWPKPKRQTW